MEDHRIVDLYWQRNERAISETAAKYGKYLQSISYQILRNTEDAEECVNDTYNDAWQSMPPHRPSILSTFLGKITRRISIDRWRKNSAEKRGGGEMALALDELEECVAGTGDVEAEVEKLGDYPLISVAEAKEKLLDGQYQTSVPVPMPGEKYIAKVELVYRSGPKEETLLPYYRFYVELQDGNGWQMTQSNGLKTYGAYYVPAIQDDYISNLSTYNGYFN